MDGQGAYQPSEHNTRSDKYHVRQVRRAVGVPDLLGRPVDMKLGAHQRHHIAPVNFGSRA